MRYSFVEYKVGIVITQDFTVLETNQAQKKTKSEKNTISIVPNHKLKYVQIDIAKVVRTRPT